MRIKVSNLFKSKLSAASPAVQKKALVALRLFKSDPTLHILNDHALTKLPYIGSRSINVTDDYRAIYKPYLNLAYFYNFGTHTELYGKR